MICVIQSISNSVSVFFFKISRFYLMYVFHFVATEGIVNVIVIARRFRHW